MPQENIKDNDLLIYCEGEMDDSEHLLNDVS